MRIIVCWRSHTAHNDAKNLFVLSPHLHHSPPEMLLVPGPDFGVAVSVYLSVTVCICMCKCEPSSQRTFLSLPLCLALNSVSLTLLLSRAA